MRDRQMVRTFCLLQLVDSLSTHVTRACASKGVRNGHFLNQFVGMPSNPKTDLTQFSLCQSDSAMFGTRDRDNEQRF